MGLLVALAALAPAVASPAAAHHVGAYVPRDNEVSANFKQIKFAVQARKFGVRPSALEAGALRAEMQAQAARLPAGLERRHARAPGRRRRARRPSAAS